MTTNGKDEIQHVSDPMWSHTIYQLISNNQTSMAGDHVLHLKEGGIVACDGIFDDQNTHLKVYKGLDESTQDVAFMFECINGPLKDQMIIIDNDRLSFRKKTKPFIRWSDAEKDMIFKRKYNPEGYYCSLLLMNSSPGQYIGFDGSGKAKIPSKVDLTSADAWFYFNAIQ